MTNYKKPEDRRYLGKIMSKDGPYGSYKSISMDNHAPDNPRNEGALVWVDKKTGQSYQVKSISIKGVSDASKERGWENSIAIDLENSYHVDNLSDPKSQTPQEKVVAPEDTPPQIERPKKFSTPPPTKKQEVSDELAKYGLA